MHRQRRMSFYNEHTMRELKQLIRKKFLIKLKLAREADQEKNRPVSDTSEPCLDFQMLFEPSTTANASSTSKVEDISGNDVDLITTLLLDKELTQNVTRETISNIGNEIKVATTEELLGKGNESEEDLKEMIDELFKTCVICDDACDDEGFICCVCQSIYF